MKKNLFAEILGWYGVVAIIAAYGLLNFGILSVSNIWYQILNGTGAIGIVYDSFRDKDYQPVVLNIIWAVIAIFAIIKILFY